MTKTFKFLFILILMGPIAHTFAMHQMPDYSNIYRVAEKNITIIRAVQLPEGTSIEVIHDITNNTYYGGESHFAADREFEANEAQSKFKELTQLLDKQKSKK